MNRISACLALTLLWINATFALESVPKSEYHQRRITLSQQLKGGAALVFAAEEPALDFMPYRQDSDFYYLSGWNEPGAALLVIAASPETKTSFGDVVTARSYRDVLFLPRRNLRTERYTGAKMDAGTQDVSAKTGFDSVMPMTELPVVLGAFLAEDARRYGSLWWQTDMPAAKTAMAFVETTLGGSGSMPGGNVRTLTMNLRAVKSAAEIDLIRKATDASVAAQLAGIRAVDAGAAERAVAGIEIAKMMQEGCERPSYSPIVGSGANSSTLHYSENSSTMNPGDVVVIDAAGEYSMYASDITRTMPVNGKFTPRQREIYDIVLGAQRAAAAAFVPGKYKLGNISQRGPEVKDTLDKVAYDYINTHGKDMHGNPLGKYFMHGIGHSVGIDVHDPMDPKQTLDKGMVFTIEPGIYIPEENIGIRIEDIYYVDPNGKLVDLVAALPHEAADIEAIMQKKR